MKLEKDDMLAHFLDGLYQEIHALEQAHGFQAGRTSRGEDYRAPIDAHHDAIRAWRSGEAGHARGDRLSVSWLSHDLTALRQRSAWLRSGPHVFWEGRGVEVPASREEARALKRRLIRETEFLEISHTLLAEDLRAFGRLVTHGGRPDMVLLQSELRQREAEKHLASDQWVYLPAEEFWQGFAYTLGFFKSLAEDLSLAFPPSQIEERGLGARLLRREDPHKKGEEALKSLWIQITHPLSLQAALRSTRSFTGKTGYGVDPMAHLPETRWQNQEADARTLADAYERYALIFAAALAGAVDKHYKELLGDMDALVEEGAELLILLDKVKAGDQTVELHTIDRLIRELKNEALKRQLLALLDQLKTRRTDSSGLRSNLSQATKSAMTGADQEIDILEQAHFNFLATQFALYEDAKDIVKKLATQGLNLAGKFTEAAAAMAAARDRGSRGGRGR